MSRSKIAEVDEWMLEGLLGILLVPFADIRGGVVVDSFEGLRSLVDAVEPGVRRSVLEVICLKSCITACCVFCELVVASWPVP